MHKSVPEKMIVGPKKNCLTHLSEYCSLKRKGQPLLIWTTSYSARQTEVLATLTTSVGKSFTQLWTKRALSVYHEPTGFHLFRHTAGSIVHKQTRSVKLAQTQLGHSRMATTAQTIYIHTDEELRRLLKLSWRPFCNLAHLLLHLGAPEDGKVQ